MDIFVRGRGTLFCPSHSPGLCDFPSYPWYSDILKIHLTIYAAHHSVPPFNLKTLNSVCGLFFYHVDQCLHSFLSLLLPGTPTRWILFLVGVSFISCKFSFCLVILDWEQGSGARLPGIQYLRSPFDWLCVVGELVVPQLPHLSEMGVMMNTWPQVVVEMVTLRLV